MRTRPVLAATASVAALGLCVASSSASAATTTPAKGTAKSVLSLLQVNAAGHALRLGDLTLLSDTLSGTPLSSIDLTPLTTDGTAVGKQTITPANSPLTVPAVSSPGALSSIVSLTSPVFNADATDDPSAEAGADSLGSLKLLGLDIPLDGTLDLGSAVDATDGAISGKALEIDGLALPSIADLLAALGLDLTKLPVTVLNTLVNQLDLVTGVVSAAQAAAASALAQVNTATQTLNTATSSLSTATAGVTTATTAVTSATSALQAELDKIPLASLIGLPAGSDTVAGFLNLSSVLQGTLELVVPTITGALTTLTSANAALAAAQTLVTTATAALAAAQSALTALIATLQSTLAPLVTALTGVLDSTPLLSIDKLALTSTAIASSNKAGGQEAEVLGGTLTGLNVLGTDVLDDVLGTSSIDLVDLVGTTVTDLTSTISGLTGTLSTVLSTVPGLPALKIPAPQISLLTKSATTSISDGFGRANTAVTGLKITLPAVAIPAALALPGADTLPGLSLVNGLLSSAPISLSLATLSDQSAFAPAVVGTTPPPVTGPGTPTTDPGAPTLPTTGLPAGLAIVALLSVGGALVLRRRISA